MCWSDESDHPAHINRFPRLLQQTHDLNLEYASISDSHVQYWEVSRVTTLERMVTYWPMWGVISAMLPSWAGEFFLLHNNIQGYLEDYFRFIGISVSKENANWLEGLVPKQYLKKYCDFIHSHNDLCRAPGAIVPDTWIHHSSQYKNQLIQVDLPKQSRMLVKSKQYKEQTVCWISGKTSSPLKTPDRWAPLFDYW